MRQRVAWLALPALLIAASAAAQEASDSVKWVGAGKIEIKSTVVAPTGCYSGGSAVKGSPEGATFVENAILITYPLMHSGSQICTQALKPVQFSIITDAPAGAQAIVIYTTDKFAKSISAKALALPAKPARKK